MLAPLIRPLEMVICNIGLGAGSDPDRFAPRLSGRTMPQKNTEKNATTATQEKRNKFLVLYSRTKQDCYETMPLLDNYSTFFSYPSPGVSDI